MKQPIQYDKLKEIILSCKSKRTQALLAFQYVLACRVGELLYYKHKESTFENKKTGEMIVVLAYETFGLLVSNIREYSDYWEVIVPNFKQQSGIIKYKTGFILKQSGEDWLRNICLNWIKGINNDRVFVFQEERARQLIREELKAAGFDNIAKKCFSSHNLRDSRADHLLKLFGFNILDVQKTLGHKSLQSTQSYIDSSIQERVEKLKQAIGNEEDTNN